MAGVNKYCNYINHPITGKSISKEINPLPVYKYKKIIKKIDNDGSETGIEYDAIFYTGAIYFVDANQEDIQYASAINMKPKKIESDVPVEPNFIIATNIKGVKSQLSINGKINTSYPEMIYVNGALFFTFGKTFNNPNIYPLGTLIENPTDSQYEWVVNNHPDWNSNGKIQLPTPDDRILYGNGNFKKVASSVGTHTHTAYISHAHSGPSINHTHSNKTINWNGTSSGGGADKTRKIKNNCGGTWGYELINFYHRANSYNFIEINANNSSVNLPRRIKLMTGIYLA